LGNVSRYLVRIGLVFQGSRVVEDRPTYADWKRCSLEGKHGQ